MNAPADLNKGSVHIMRGFPPRSLVWQLLRQLTMLFYTHLLSGFRIRAVCNLTDVFPQTIAYKAYATTTRPYTLNCSTACLPSACQQALTPMAHKGHTGFQPVTLCYSVDTYRQQSLRSFTLSLVYVTSGLLFVSQYEVSSSLRCIRLSIEDLLAHQHLSRLSQLGPSGVPSLSIAIISSLSVVIYILRSFLTVCLLNRTLRALKTVTAWS